MKNITYISAGAGSGKTYTLTHKLADLFIADPGLRPEHVILTTFTRKAAAELMNRTRELLCQQGYYDTAARLDNALIGTVHSIGFALISKYWFYLGLSPKLNILDDKGLSKYIDLTLGATASTDDLNFFSRLVYALGIKNNSYGATPLDWKANLKDIIEKAHNFGMSDIEICIQKSCELIDKAYRFCHAFPDLDQMVDTALVVLPQLKTRCENPHRQNMRNNCKVIIEAINRLVKKLEAYKGADKDKKDDIDTLTSLRWFIADDMAEIMNRDTANAYRFPELDDYEDLCKKYIYHPDIIKLLKDYVNRVFNLAVVWQKEYESYKKSHNVLDYNDIEKYLLELLERNEVREEISRSYRYLMVDEFQDCNTVQIGIFRQLASLMRHTWWVGDTKQSIYAFRGSNTQLVDTVTAGIVDKVNGCCRENLSDSYRSVPDLVDFANKIFGKVFAGMGNVCLNPTKEECKEITATRFVRVPLVNRNSSKNAAGVAALVASLIGDPAYKNVCDKLGDFAVLVRNKSYAIDIAQALRKLGVPVCAETDVNSSREWMLLSALLTLCENPDNYLTRATIAHLVADGYSVPSIIDKKLEYDNGPDRDDKKWLLDIPLINATIKFASAHQHLSVSAFVKAIIQTLGLEAYSDVWSDGCAPVWGALIARAEDYEAKSITLGSNPTLQGFIKDESSQRPSVSDKDAVHVMTYHSAKGLEWPVTVLLSLDDDHVSTKTIVEHEICNVSAYRDSATGENIICLLPQISPDPHCDVMANLESCGLVNREAERVKGEESRLLYVGVTRASHQLVLVTHKNDNANPYNWFREMGITPDMELIPDPIEFSASNVTVDIQRQTFGHPCATAFVRRDPLYVSPSQTKGTGAVELVEKLGERFKVTDSDVTKFGNCIHQIYCGLDRNHSVEYTQGLLDSYEVRANAADIVEIWDKFVKLLTDRYGEAVSVDHELAFKQARGGQIVTGSIDFVWNTPLGCVLVDYKTFPGKMGDVFDKSNAHYAGHYKGQLDCYTTALEKAGRKVIDRLIFYPSLGLVVRVN